MTEDEYADEVKYQRWLGLAFVQTELMRLKLRLAHGTGPDAPTLAVDYSSLRGGIVRWEVLGAADTDLVDFTVPSPHMSDPILEDA